MDPFYKDLANWATALIAASQAERDRLESIQQLNHAIDWAAGEIARLSEKQKHRPRAGKELARVRYEKRRYEIELAFLLTEAKPNT